MILVKHNDEFSLYGLDGSTIAGTWKEKPSTAKLQLEHSKPVMYRDVDAHGESEIPFPIDKP
jgi:hypothetical protein